MTLSLSVPHSVPKADVLFWCVSCAAPLRHGLVFLSYFLFTYREFGKSHIQVFRQPPQAN